MIIILKIQLCANFYKQFEYIDGLQELQACVDGYISQFFTISKRLIYIDFLVTHFYSSNMVEMTPDTSLPTKVLQQEKPQTSTGSLKTFREKVFGMFKRNVSPLTEEVSIVRPPQLPEFNPGNIPPIKWPERPDKNWARRKENPVSDVIHQTPEGPVIDANKDSAHKLAQEMTAIKELVPEPRRKELDQVVDQLLTPESNMDPVDKIRAIEDPTDRQYALGEFSRRLAFKQLTNDGAGGNISNNVLNPRIAEIYSGYKSRVFPSAQISA